jgi:hypothetical protein
MLHYCDTNPASAVALPPVNCSMAARGVFSGAGSAIHAERFRSATPTFAIVSIGGIVGNSFGHVKLQKVVSGVHPGWV